MTMGDTVHLLLGSERYYPPHDSTLAVFETRDDAEAMRDVLQDASGPGNKAEWAALRDTYEWLPKYSCEYYSVESYTVR